MRDTFYSWLFLALWLSGFFGSALGRAEFGKVDWYELIVSAALGIVSTISAIQHYKKQASAQSEQEGKD